MRSNFKRITTQARFMWGLSERHEHMAQTGKRARDMDVLHRQPGPWRDVRLMEENGFPSVAAQAALPCPALSLCP